MAEIRPYFTYFLIRSDAMTFKIDLSEQISLHFRLKTKSQDEFIYIL